jgi:hypothetical protein
MASRAAAQMSSGGNISTPMIINDLELVNCMQKIDQFECDITTMLAGSTLQLMISVIGCCIHISIVRWGGYQGYAHVPNAGCIQGT